MAPPLLRRLRSHHRHSFPTDGQLTASQATPLDKADGHLWTFSTVSLKTLPPFLGVRPLSPPRKRQETAQFSPPATHQRRHKRRASNKKNLDLDEYLWFVKQCPKKRRKKEVDHFSTLPDEMILRVLGWVGKVGLGRMALVSKRFSRLTQDESLWSRIDCQGATLGVGALDVICQRKPTFLRLARGTIKPSTLTSTWSLTHLDLTMTLIDPHLLSQLLSNCPKLTHLSVEHCRLDNQVLTSLTTAKPTLQVLNFCMCYGLGVEALSDLLEGCQGLLQLNLSCISQQQGEKEKWTDADLTTLVKHLPQSLLQLNLAGFRYVMRDQHTSLLSTQLPALIDLDLSDSQELTGQSLEHLTRLKSLQHLGLSRCYSIEPQAYSVLSTIKTLRYLELFSLFKEASIKSLAATVLQGIEINQFPFSAIGRPTVGTRRSSIWGVRVREV